jgi:hypothetical protein
MGGIMPVENSRFRHGRSCMSAVLTLAVLLITLKVLALQKTDPKSGPAAKDPQQALAMAALEAIDLNEAESEKLPRTPALDDTARQAELAIGKLPRFVGLCGPPRPWPGKVDPESGAKEYCALVRLDLEVLLNKAERVAGNTMALALDPGNNDRKEELARAIKEYQVLRAWLEARLKKWNLYKTEPAVPTKVTAVPTDKESNHPPATPQPISGAAPKTLQMSLDSTLISERG